MSTHDDHCHAECLVPDCGCTMNCTCGEVEDPPVVSPSWLAERVRRVLDGAYYVTYHRSGKAQVNLDPDAREAWEDLEVFRGVKARVADGYCCGTLARSGTCSCSDREQNVGR